MKYFLKTSHYHTTSNDAIHTFISIIPSDLAIIAEDGRSLVLDFKDFESIPTFKEQLLNFFSKEIQPLKSANIRIYGYYPHHDWSVFSSLLLQELKFSYCKNIKDISDGYSITEDKWPSSPEEYSSIAYAKWIKDSYFEINRLRYGKGV